MTDKNNDLHTGSLFGGLPKAFTVLFGDSKFTLRFTVFIVIILIVLAGFILIFLNLYQPEKIKIGDSTLTFTAEKDVAQTVLPSNVVWLDTEIKIKPNQSVNVKADGRIHLAVHYIVEAAQKDFVVKYPWSDPDGEGPSINTIEQLPGDASRNGQKLCPSAKFGQLLAYVGPEVLNKDNPWPRDGKIQVLGREAVIENNTDTKQKIWLAVNDIILRDDDFSEQAYLLNEDSCDLAKRYKSKSDCDLEAVIEAKKHWKQIKDNKYWNIWFDDNIGSYVIKFDMKSPVKGDDVNYCSMTREDYIENFNKSKNIGNQQIVKESYTILELNDIYPKAIELAAKYGSEENVLIIFDIDNTLLAMDRDLGSDQWYSWQSSLENDNINKISSLLDAQRALFFIGAMRLTQNNMPKFLIDLHERGFQTAALTARGLGSRLVTFRELKRNKIEFSNSLFSTNSRKEFMPLTSSSKQKVLYEDGVLMAAGQNKGAIFLELFSKSYSNKIKGIIFVDDKDYNIVNFEEALYEEAYDLVTFLYTGEDENVKKFQEESTMKEWCEIEYLLKEIQNIVGNSNFNLSSTVTPACDRFDLKHK